MEHCRFKNTGLTSKELLDTLTSLLTDNNKCVYDAIEGKDIKDIIYFNLSFFNNDEIKNMVKKNNSDFIVVGIVENNSSIVKVSCYQKMSSRRWYEVLALDHQFLGKDYCVFEYNALPKILEGIDNAIKNYDNKLYPDISKVMLFALNISDELEKVNIKKNNSFLNNDIFLKLTENNYFGITQLRVIPFGINCRKNKVDSHYTYTFKRELFDVELSCSWFKIDNSIDIDTVMKKYYIKDIHCLISDDDGTTHEEILENDMCEYISTYIKNRIDNYADIFRLYGLKETY